MKKKNAKNEMSLEEELFGLQIMVKMGMLDMKELTRIVKEIGKEHNLNIILREHNRTTNKTTIQYI